MDKPTLSLLKKQCYIDGKWVGEPALSVTNPANGTEVAKVPLATAKQAQEAIAAAERAGLPAGVLNVKIGRASCRERV